MQDAPDAARLLGAVADTLETEVLARSDPSVQHEVRVAANLCRIVQREVALGAAADGQEREALASLVGHEGRSDDLWRELAERLAGGEAPAPESEVHAVLLRIVRNKLAVAKPGYDAYDFAGERPGGA